MIKQQQANEIADSLIQEARAQSDQKMQKVAARNTIVDRVRTAMVTLLGFGFGWRAAESWLGLDASAPLVAAVTAILVAIIFPGRKQT